MFNDFIKAFKKPGQIKLGQTKARITEYTKSLEKIWQLVLINVKLDLI